MPAKMSVPYNYLGKQFAEGSSLRSEIMKDIGGLVDTGDYTLGSWVPKFEEAWAEKMRAKYAVGVSNGTDALFLIMKAMGIGPGDFVVTQTNTFLATVGAILQAGAQPVLADVGDDYLISLDSAFKRLEREVPFDDRRKTAFCPVDLTGNPTPVHKMPLRKRSTFRDAAQAVGATYDNRPLTQDVTACSYSLHPLKNVHGWTDSGVVTTDDESLAKEIKLLRNHGLKDRDTCVVPGYNHRISTLAAIVGYHVLGRESWITETRRSNAKIYDQGLAGVKAIKIPTRDPLARQAYHTYVVQTNGRDHLKAHLEQHGIETKVHYPIPVHLQPGFAFLGYKKGDFPVAENQAANILTLPVHEYLSTEQLEYVVGTIRDFYAHAEGALPS